MALLACLFSSTGSGAPNTLGARTHGLEVREGVVPSRRWDPGVAPRKMIGQNPAFSSF